MSLLQQASAAQRGKGGASSGSTVPEARAKEDASQAQVDAKAADPILPAELFPQRVSERDLAEWPVRVPDTPDVAGREATCKQAFQSSFECHLVPPELGGPPCPCFESQNTLDNCNNWYAMQMTGSKYFLPDNTNTVPLTGNYSQTTEFCNKVFQMAYDCMEIPMADGGAKGEDCHLDCQKWFNQCMGGDEHKPAQHKGTVAWP